MTRMQSLSRSPILKLGIALAVNLGLVFVCHRYWAISTAHIHQQVQNQQQGVFQQQLELLRAQQDIKLEELRQHLDRALEPPVQKATLLNSFKIDDENLHLTHDLAIPRDIPAWTAQDTAMLYTTMGFNMMNELLRSEYSKGEILSNKEQLDFSLSSRAERTYKSLWHHILPIYRSMPGTTSQEKDDQLYELSRSRAEIDFFFRLEHKLYPWLHRNFRTSFALRDTYSGRGIVVCAGNNQFEFASTSIQAIRRLNKDVPIQVFYMGNNDLSPERQTFFREMTSHIEVVDVTTILDNDYMQLGGWAIKAYALLASRFEEVMLVDSDAFFLRNPMELFDDPGYKAMGSLFFYDRTLWPDWTAGPNWMRSMMPMMSSFPPLSRWFRGVASHEQESGVVVINKGLRLNGLLAVCKMNSKNERDLWSYRIFYGDKETFWVGYEMVQEPYAFMQGYGGIIGEMRSDPRLDVAEGGEASAPAKPQRPIVNEPSVCGAQLHTDHQGRPMWWNGGLMRNKNEGWKQELGFDFWMDGGGRQRHRERLVRNEELKRELLRVMKVQSLDDFEQEKKDPEWIFAESCLYGETVHELDAEQKELTSAYLRIERLVKQESQKIAAGHAVDAKVHDWASI
ncbi:hypothetical protein EMPS_03368 [Entomortierella parvispora]|uniref:Alpha-1,3-mannosyltransferase n=1 Tax=Entomortierella parvispora TaxID=205924 RepID=A0A9P3LUG4_9FUNG|nr:hypothetical protein EMPS_03368 [Entomortierella parvispora]